MKDIIYKYQNYKSYLKEIFSTSGERRGYRSKLAKRLNCQTGFISQVLNGKTNFSLEHCLMISEFISHDKEESHFFMLLVQLEKSGTTELENYYQSQLDNINEKRSLIQGRLKEASKLDIETHSLYYSKWYYSAIHILVSISKFQTFEEIKNKIKLAPQTISKALSMLQKSGLILLTNGRYSIGKNRIHLSKNSPNISKHHTNWRIEAIKSLEEESKNDIHYSMVFTMSKKDSVKIKNKILEFIEDLEPIYLDSKEEEIFGITLDFFNI